MGAHTAPRTATVGRIAGRGALTAAAALALTGGTASFAFAGTGDHPVRSAHDCGCDEQKSWYDDDKGDQDRDWKSDDDRDWKSDKDDEDRDWKSDEDDEDRDWKSDEDDEDRDWKSDEDDEDCDDDGHRGHDASWDDDEDDDHGKRDHHDRGHEEYKDGFKDGFGVGYDYGSKKAENSDVLGGVLAPVTGATSTT